MHSSNRNILLTYHPKSLKLEQENYHWKDEAFQFLKQNTLLVLLKLMTI